MELMHIAKICHEANRALCEEQGDMSQPIWENAPKWQIQSAINQVKACLDNPNEGPEHTHNSWLKEKKESGWKYGPVKDPDKKEHPCFVSYNKLPENQKAKDYLFNAIVNSLSKFVEEKTHANA